MKLSDVFWNAAQKIGSTHGCCCWAINIEVRISGAVHIRDDALNFFAQLFRPAMNATMSRYWWKDFVLSQDDQEARRLALLFAHWIALDEGL